MQPADPLATSIRSQDVRRPVLSPKYTLLTLLLRSQDVRLLAISRKYTR